MINSQITRPIFFLLSILFFTLNLNAQTSEKNEKSKVARPVSKVDNGTGGKLEENSEFEKKDQTWEVNDEKSLLKSIDYPELQVVPRASERLTMEAIAEREIVVGPYWPVQLSSVFLLLSSSMSNGKYAQENPNDNQKENNLKATQTGTLLGALWLGTTIYLEKSSNYGKGVGDMKKITGKDKKSILLRERLAEEYLERPAKLAKTVTRLAAWTNLLAAMNVSSHSSTGTPDYNGMAIAAAFLPFIFDNRYEDNWDKHLEYKRKIYAPLAGVDLIKDEKSGQFLSMMTLNWEFE